MDQEQYRCLHENRRPHGPLPLGQPRRPDRSDKAPLSILVGRAARLLRQREAAAAAWERLVGSELLAETAVDALVGDTLYIAVTSSTLRYELDCRRTWLEKGMLAAVPGMRRLRFVVRGCRVSEARPAD